jgi:hypothetical protein
MDILVLLLEAPPRVPLQRIHREQIAAPVLARRRQFGACYRLANSAAGHVQPLCSLGGGQRPARSERGPLEWCAHDLTFQSTHEISQLPELFKHCTERPAKPWQFTVFRCAATRGRNCRRIDLHGQVSQAKASSTGRRRALPRTSSKYLHRIDLRVKVLH